MKKDCYIVEDLLPLYVEGLLQDETTEWLEKHLEQCESCKKLAKMTENPLVEVSSQPTKSNEKMIKRIQFKLNIYQMIFVCVSFIFAMRTSLLNDSMGFILSYTLLGFVLFLFYKSYKTVVAIALLPTFFWSIGTILLDLNQEFTGTIFQQNYQIIVGSLFVAFLHLIFSIIGATIGLLVHKLKEGETA